MGGFHGHTCTHTQKNKDKKQTLSIPDLIVVLYKYFRVQLFMEVYCLVINTVKLNLIPYSLV